ncbi:MAG: hypothetical protein A3D95_08480 [Betaproteobacteria bacterium RIFCSPHIGHO2_12_FULL_69_13]|nr:MAG: hypothetical protein A3D95_08480 [Betaproteobacteria bacterium RIFCSPHIGHO2_12_FULL_69_13]OGA65850.1 MAG: hypothetical protein A3G83_01710 [Betaproteobacteria bacterium RIFCSPLOWO2_12_FULL_68_20]
MRERTVSRAGGKARIGSLLRGFGRAAFACLFLVSGVASAYCSIDRGPLPVTIELGAPFACLDTAGSPGAPRVDQACEVPDLLSVLQVAHVPSPGDIAAPAAPVATYPDRGRKPANASILGFSSRPSVRPEPIFRRVPRLLI